MKRLAVGSLVAILILTTGFLVFRRTLKSWWKAKEPWAGRFEDPEGLAVDAEGNVYIADEDRGLFWMVDKAGKELAKIREIEGLGVLTSGDSLVVLGPGHVIVIGAAFNVIEVEIAAGKAKVLRWVGRKGTAPGEFGDPEGIARDATGDYYVTDEDNRRIQIFDKDLKFLREWRVQNDPESVCIAGDRVFVTFSKDDYIACFDRQGAEKFRFGETGGGERQFRNPDCAAVSPEGRLYVTDQKNNRLQVFDLEGRFQFAIGQRGKLPGQFEDPEDIAFDRDGNLHVADGGNHRVQVLSPAGKPIRVIE